MFKRPQSLVSMAAVLCLLGEGLASAKSEPSTPAKACAQIAHAHYEQSLSLVQSDYEANAAACYELLDVSRFASVPLCLRASEAARQDATREAAVQLALMLGSCE